MEATFAPAVGMACCSLKDNGDELLGTRHGLPAFASCGVTMGLALLHPWIGRLPSWRYSALGETVRLPISPRLHTDGSGLPVNGVQSGPRAWHVDSLQADERGAHLRATLAFDHDPRQLELFPFPHRLHLDADLVGRALTLTVTVEATSSAAVPVCLGLRAFLRRDEEDGAATIALPSRTAIETDSRLLPTGAAHPVGAWVHSLDGITRDDLFALDHGRRMTVASSSHGATVEPGNGFAQARVRSVADDPDVLIDALTAEPGALAHGAFPVATIDRPYRAVLRVTPSAARRRAARRRVTAGHAGRPARAHTVTRLK
jgi:galactose mutarotase-like enzyme